MYAHFYTTDAAEQRNAIDALGFCPEGTACYVDSNPPAGPTPLYRGLSPGGSHLYTTSVGEWGDAINTLGYKGEGITGYIFGAPQPGYTPLYRAYQRSSDDHFYTTNFTEHENAIQNLGYSDEGITGYVASNPGPNVVPLYRLYKISHFYTTDSNERQHAIQNLGFTDEGVACWIFNAPAPGALPLYRGLSSTVSHLYTMSIAEFDNALNNLGYKSEGIACYIFAAPQGSLVPLYRAYRPSENDHFYTTDLAEHQNAVAHLGYNDEGVTGYVSSGAATGLIPFYRLYGPRVFRVIPFQEQPQQQSEWCWSASTVSITRFYDPASTWAQCALVNEQFTLTTCCTNGSSPDCNQPWHADRALAATGHLAGTSGSLSLDDLADQLMGNHPISIAIEWIGGGGHNPVITGFDRDGGETIFIQDPIFGPSTQDYNSFPATYQSGASWSASFLTK